MGGGTGSAQWLQVGGMVLTVVGVMVGVSMGGGPPRGIEDQVAAAAARGRVVLDAAGASTTSHAS